MSQFFSLVSLFLVLFGSLALMPLAGASPAEPSSNFESLVEPAWDGNSNPVFMEPGFEYRFERLPLFGELTKEKLPWSDPYWQNNLRGIAYRWLEERRSFRYYLPLAQLQHMSAEDLAILSPAEKYDIFRGRYDYPLTQSELGRTSPRDKEWEGICHGWAPAAIHHPEPAAVTVVNPDGISIPFASSDVKALLSLAYAEKSENTRFLGTRCWTANLRTFMRSPNFRRICDDYNAGSFHVVIANQLGMMQQGFTADVDPTQEVWNQPVYGYSSVVLGQRGPSRGSAYGTVRELLVRTRMLYTDESDAAWEPKNGTSLFKSAEKTYEYFVELDGSDQVVGGRWQGSTRPGFVWKVDSLRFEGEWADLLKIYHPAGAVVPTPVPAPSPAPSPTP